MLGALSILGSLCHAWQVMLPPGLAASMVLMSGVMSQACSPIGITHYEAGIKRRRIIRGLCLDTQQSDDRVRPR